jgi:hypothetical protein
MDLSDCLEALDNRNISSESEKNKAKKMLQMIAEYLINENIINDEGEVDYDRIDEIIEECGDNEE